MRGNEMRAMFMILPLVLLLSGCGRHERPQAGAGSAGKAESAEERDIREALARLPEADRRLAAAQRYCATSHENRLGSMGAPVKVMIQGQPVFLCCGGCEKDARDNEIATLATVER